MERTPWFTTESRGVYHLAEPTPQHKGFKTSKIHFHKAKYSIFMLKRQQMPVCELVCVILCPSVAGFGHFTQYVQAIIQAPLLGVLSNTRMFP